MREIKVHTADQHFVTSVSVQLQRWSKNTNSERSDSIHTAGLKQGISQQQRSQK